MSEQREAGTRKGVESAGHIIAALGRGLSGTTGTTAAPYTFGGGLALIKSLLPQR